MAQSVDTPYALALLSEYTHTLDTLPIDLSRNFADLRELDAVLSSSIISITAKIHNLTSMIEQGTATKEDRLWLLTDIAEEAHRLRLGGEDKIRVASQAADNLKAHSNLLRALTEHLPGFDSSVLERRTVYPHVSERSFLPAITMEPGRRRRGGFGSIMVASNPEPSPAKRKRVPKDDDVDITKSPRKAQAVGGPETNDSTSTSRGGNNKNNNILPSTAHPSLPPPYGNTNGHNHVSSTYDVHSVSNTHGISDALDWSIPRTQQLEGPGMPVARSTSLHSQPASAPTLHSAAAADPTDTGDGDGDGDDRTYCICDRVSYGEMIACDDGQCEREWVCSCLFNNLCFY